MNDWMKHLGALKLAKLTRLRKAFLLFREWISKVDYSGSSDVDIVIIKMTGFYVCGVYV